MEFPVSWENEIKLWTFLETRAALLLKAYKTTSEVSVFKAHYCGTFLLSLPLMTKVLSFEALL